MRAPGLIALALALAGCPPKHEYPDGGGLVGQLNREVQALQQANRALEYEAATCRDADAPPDSLYQELYQVLRGTEVEIAREGRTTVVTFPSAHLFGVDEFSLRQEARMTLDVMSTALRLHPDYTIDVEGHTDDFGVPASARKRFGDPFTYSAARAHAVVATLVDEFDLDPERFGVVGRGPNVPLDTNDTEAGRRHNRRVVMYIRPPVSAPE